MNRIPNLSEFALFARAGMWVVAARIGLWVVSYQNLRGAVTFLTRKNSSHHCDSSLPQFQWAVSAASRFVPRSTCLVKALALHVLLKRAGLQSSIHFGVAKQGESFEAHAWVESQNQIVIGNFESNRYLPMMIWE